MESVSLVSPLSVIGWAWSLGVIYLLYTQRGVQLSSRWQLLLLTGPLMVASVLFVASEVDVIRQLAGGVDPLDVHYGYGAADIETLALALGAEGRLQYAIFQLGADTLAPPAFAGFILNVTRASVAYAGVRSILTWLISVYFFSVLLANTLMPLVMLQFPDAGGFVGSLYSVVPVLDWLKYSSHGLGWLLIFGSWLAMGVKRLRA